MHGPQLAGRVLRSVNGEVPMPAQWTPGRDVSRNHSRIGLAMAWPGHIPRPMLSSGDLGAGGESHSPLLPGFCPTPRTANSQDGRLHLGRCVGRWSGARPLPPTWEPVRGALGVNKMRLWGRGHSCTAAKASGPSPGLPDHLLAAQMTTASPAVHSLLSAKAGGSSWSSGRLVAVTLRAGPARPPACQPPPACVDEGKEDKPIFILSARRLVWL